MRLSVLAFIGFVSAQGTNKFAFPFEAIQLTDSDVGNFSAIAFADGSEPTPAPPDCKAFPGDEGWPADDEWDRLNASLSGALLKPVPAASACYDGPYEDREQCNFLRMGAGTSRFYSDDPLTVLTQWPQGNTCLVSAAPRGECTQGGFPTYVVNATTVRGIQITVNFARNKNIRLVIKNTGHDFLGRSTGAASISIWTHYLKDFELLSDYTKGEYTGLAAHVGSGLEAWNAHNLMYNHNITLVTPLTMTVGAYGGFLAGGGHSTFASYHGMASDQVLSLTVVTADGRLVTADPDTNSDLFYALRGGGGSTYGVVTSVIVKAHPPVNVGIATVSFSSGGWGGSGDAEEFWQAINAYFSFGKSIVDAGGIDRNYIESLGDSRFSFTTDLEMPNMTVAELTTFLEPIMDALEEAGVSVSRPRPTSGRYGTPQNGKGASPDNSRFTSRLFPRANWDNETLFSATMEAIRGVVEDGYRFHGLFMGPSEAIAGDPGRDSGLNPAWRSAIMHADVFDYASMTGSASSVIEAYERLNSSTNLLREVTPGSGAYVNEADVQEPDWQKSFFGEKYPRLLEIKMERDPWNLFWAPAMVGSEGWEVRTEDGLPTQNGKLCQVK